MSRNPEHQFVSTDPEGIIAWLIARYEEITGNTVRPASPDRLLIQWAAVFAVHYLALTNYAGNQNIPRYASGENLDVLGEQLYGLKRPGSKAASCTVRFSISEPQNTAVLIPAGTRVTDSAGTFIWETLADAYIPIGETSIELSVRCQTAGTVGNGYAVGQLNKAVDLYDYYSGCVNVTASDGGADAASDEEYYGLFRDKMDTFSTAGARGAYVYYAKQVSTEIIDVVANSPTPGVVKLYVLANGGALASGEMKSAVLAACNADEVRPLTDLVFVEDAEIVPYDVDFTYYLESGTSRSAAAVAAAVREAVDAYNQWQCGKLGRDINPSRLHQLLMDAGVKRVELRSPAFAALRDGKDGDVPQAAQLRTEPVIISGGYEDE